MAGHTAGIFSVAFSPDGGQLATAGHDGIVIVWDVLGSLASSQGQPLLTLRGHDESAVIGGVRTGVLRVAYKVDGTELATAGADGTMRLWDAADGELLETVVVHPQGGRGVECRLQCRWPVSSR